MRYIRFVPRTINLELFQLYMWPFTNAFHTREEQCKISFVYFIFHLFLLLLLSTKTKRMTEHGTETSHAVELYGVGPKIPPPRAPFSEGEAGELRKVLHGSRSPQGNPRPHSVVTPSSTELAAGSDLFGGRSNTFGLLAEFPVAARWRGRWAELRILSQ